MYKSPRKFGFIKYVPNDLWQITKSPFQKKNLLWFSSIVVSSSFLSWQDPALQNGVKHFAKVVHLSPTSSYKTAFGIGDTKIIKIPQSLSAGIYQLGEGGTSMLVAGGLFLYGKIKHDNRSLQTASDLTEAFITMGVATQLLKRSFGRQSPFAATVPGGKWRPFPAFTDYQRHTGNYDAFPSGHLATLMATFTVLCKNYPEKKWIKPLGGVILSLVGFVMVNSNVHWVGDYPLALGIGYLSGKITAERHRHFQVKHKYVQTEEVNY
ncbi:MAG: phosphatase PAP2 family protein [Ginsengibacter sp.]